MRIHHRICDVQKHLLHRHIKLNEKVIDNYLIHVTIQQNIKNVSKKLIHPSAPSTETIIRTKHVLSRCENSSQNLWCSKTSTSHTYKTERKGY